VCRISESLTEVPSKPRVPPRTRHCPTFAIPGGRVATSAVMLRVYDSNPSLVLSSTPLNSYLRRTFHKTERSIVSVRFMKPHASSRRTLSGSSRAHDPARRLAKLWQRLRPTYRTTNIGFLSSFHHSIASPTQSGNVESSH
jgi:hypothetical protein